MSNAERRIKLVGGTGGERVVVAGPGTGTAHTERLIVEGEKWVEQYTQAGTDSDGMAVFTLLTQARESD